jgi:hypothetical protein
MNKFILPLLFVFGSCAHSVHQVHMSDFKPYESFTAGKWIKAEASQHVIFWFVKETNYVNQAREKLIAQCPKGDIQGITTRYSTSLGFFNWDNKIVMQGLCIN